MGKREMTEPKSVSAKQLRDALVEELEKSGTLTQAKSLIRNAIFESLNDRKPTEKKNLSNRQTLMASLISEWLEENGFEQSASTIKIESGLKSYLPKSIVNVELNLVPTDLPALDQLVSERIQNVPRPQKQVESDFNIVGSQPNEIIIEK